MKTPVAGKGKLLTQISFFWFDLFKDICPNHIITTQIDDMPEKVRLAAYSIQRFANTYWSEIELV
jgi:phosphoribosylaminoimidazole-succinocarboxamide synthase